MLCQTAAGFLQPAAECGKFIVQTLTKVSMFIQADYDHMINLNHVAKIQSFREGKVLSLYNFVGVDGGVLGTATMANIGSTAFNEITDIVKSYR
jgi:hypothetical protein